MSECIFAKTNNFIWPRILFIDSKVVVVSVVVVLKGVENIKRDFYQGIYVLFLL